MKSSVFTLFLLILFASCNSTPKEDATDNNVANEQVEERVEEKEEERIVTPSDLDAILEKIIKGEQSFQFYAVITEPFWSFYFLEEGVLFNGMDQEPILLQNDSVFDPSKSEQTIFLKGKDVKHIIHIKKEEGSDGMSDIVYPYSITIDNEWHGGGAEEFVKEVY